MCLPLSSAEEKWIHTLNEIMFYMFEEIKPRLRTQAIQCLRGLHWVTDFFVVILSDLKILFLLKRGCWNVCSHFIHKKIIFTGLSYRTSPGKRLRGTRSSSTSLTNSIEIQSFTHSALSKCKTVCRVISDTCQGNPGYLPANSKKARTDGGILLTLRLLLVFFRPKHKPLALQAELKVNKCS